jgi:anti-anti-sigma regulatory factor
MSSVALAPVISASTRRSLRSVRTDPTARVAHLDLTDVTRFDSATIDTLNATYTRLTAAGWRFRVTPPLAIEPRQAFHRAAIRGQLLWG